VTEKNRHGFSFTIEVLKTKITRCIVIRQRNIVAIKCYTFKQKGSP